MLTDLIAGAGRRGDPGTPAGASSVPAAWWRDRFFSDAMPGASDDAKRKAFDRAGARLQAKGLIGSANNRVWLIWKDEHKPEAE